MLIRLRCRRRLRRQRLPARSGQRVLACAIAGEMRPVDLEPRGVALARIEVNGLDDVVRAIDTGACADDLQRHRWLRARLAVDHDMARAAFAIGILALPIVALVGNADIWRRMRQHLGHFREIPRRGAAEHLIDDRPRGLREIEKLRITLAPLSPRGEGIDRPGDEVLRPLGGDRAEALVHVGEDRLIANDAEMHPELARHAQPPMHRRLVHRVPVIAEDALAARAHAHRQTGLAENRVGRLRHRNLLTFLLTRWRAFAQAELRRRLDGAVLIDADRLDPQPAAALVPAERRADVGDVADEDDARAFVLPAERNLHRRIERGDRQTAVAVIDLDVRLVVHIGAQDHDHGNEMGIEPIGDVDAADGDLTIGFAAQRLASGLRRKRIVSKRHQSRYPLATPQTTSCSIGFGRPLSISKSMGMRTCVPGGMNGVVR